MDLLEVLESLSSYPDLCHLENGSDPLQQSLPLRINHESRSTFSLSKSGDPCHPIHFENLNLTSGLIHSWWVSRTDVTLIALFSGGAFHVSWARWFLELYPACYRWVAPYSPGLSLLCFFPSRPPCSLELTLSFCVIIVIPPVVCASTLHVVFYNLYFTICIP